MVLAGNCKTIPWLVHGIVFLFYLTASASSLELAADLFEEQRWSECARECQRHLLAEPDNENALLMLATSWLREGRHREEVMGILTSLVTGASSEIRAIAGYEAGRLHWLDGNMPLAWKYHRIAFESTTSPWLYLHSSCALDTLRRRDASLAFGDPSINTQLDTTRPLWTRFIRYASNPENAAQRKTYGAGGLFIAFYRHQIRPAIGSRCSLEPSCSEYFLEANHAHGWLSIPLVADRLVREPGVVARAEKPLIINREIRYEDPLSDHNQWLGKQR